MPDPYGPWVYDDRCESEVLIQDDRGSITDRCLLQTGHDGHHRHPLNACIPVAYIAWADDAQVEPLDGAEHG